MAAITTVQGLLSRISNQYDKTVNIYLDNATTRTTTVNSQSYIVTAPRIGYIKSVPSSLETGVTAYIPTELNVTSSTGMPAMFCEMVDMGSLNLGTNTFTDGSAAPTRTYLGTSRSLPMQLWIECTTAANATPGNITFTYVDQDNNTAEASTSQAVTASATRGSGSFGTLNSTDWGVLDITAASQSGGSSPTGVLKFWGLIPISYFFISVNNIVSTVDIFPENGNFTRLGSSSQLGLISINTTTASSAYGFIRMVGDQA
jgi:hypothetical protein